MALPAAVHTATLSFGPYMDDLGQPLFGKITILSDTPRVWSATGTVFKPTPIELTLEDDGTSMVILPVTDQAGYTNGSDRAISSWTYTATFDFAGLPEEIVQFVLNTHGSTGVTIAFEAARVNPW